MSKKYHLLKPRTVKFHLRDIYPEVSIKCDPGNIYVVNDFSTQTITEVEFDLDIITPTSINPRHIKKSASISPLQYQPFAIPLKPNERMGQLRGFVFDWTGGSVAAVEQTSGEPKKSYSWHVLWMHNSLRSP